MRRMLISSLLALVGLCGCTQTTWQKTGITDPIETKRQLKIDHGRCTAEAYQSVPQTPSISQHVVVSNDQQQSGIRFIDRLPDSYARMNENIAGQPGDDARETIIDGCMARLGWSPKSS